MMMKSCAVLALVFSVVGLVGCGSDSDDSGAKGGSGGMTGSTGGTSSTGGSGGALPAWEQTCHEYCAKQDSCDASSPVTNCYDYACEPVKTLAAACQSAQNDYWKCQMRQPDICDQDAHAVACAAELSVLTNECD